MWEALLQIFMILAPSPKGMARAGPLAVFGMASYSRWIEGYRSRQHLGSCVCASASAPAAEAYLPTSAVLTYWCEYSQIEKKMQIASLSTVITVDSDLSTCYLNASDLPVVFRGGTAVQKRNFIICPHDVREV